MKRSAAVAILANIVETGNDSWRFKSRADDHTSTRARPVSATPTSTRFHRNVIRAGEEFGSRMRHLFALLPARNGDSGY
jgi:hypothetical protein